MVGKHCHYLLLVEVDHIAMEDFDPFWEPKILESLDLRFTTEEEHRFGNKNMDLLLSRKRIAWDLRNEFGFPL